MATRNCYYCNTPFLLRKSGNHAKFCSDTCRIASHKAEKRKAAFDATTLTLKIGPMNLTVTGLEPDRDKEKLRQTIIDVLGPDLIEKVSALPTPNPTPTPPTTGDTEMAEQQQERVVDPAYETRIPVHIVYEDGWEQQTNISRAELADIVGSERLVGSTLRTVAEVR